MARQIEKLTIREAYEQCNLEVLRPLGVLFQADPPTRKRDLVPLLADSMAKVEVVRLMYDALKERGRSAVREATHHPRGELVTDQFEAKYGGLPGFGDRKEPSPLGLFFPRGWQLPTDLQKMLKTFVPKPEAAMAATEETLPESVPLGAEWDGEEVVPLRQRPTAIVAQQEIRTMLRLVEAGKVRVSDKTRKPDQASVKTIGEVLVSGDFYDRSDRTDDYEGDPGADLVIRAFAWPLLLQAGELVALSGGCLELTTLGRKALGRPPHEVLDSLWTKWAGTSHFDEFQRVNAIKGQGKAHLTDPGKRRLAVMTMLRKCPVGRWIAVDEFFRLTRASGHDFELAKNPWDFYIAEHYYGNFGYEGRHDWEMLQGRFVLAFLFEYAATLGLIDVAYIPPQGSRDDFTDHWGSDDYSCLSRYDGLRFLRINALGAWCLSLTPNYQPEAPPSGGPRFRVLANLDVVAAEGAPDPADVLLLDRVAERTSESVWRLDREKILASVEDGFNLDDLDSLLKSRSIEPVPQAVPVFLGDVKDRAGRLRDLGTARLIGCADAETAHLLAHDGRLKKLCQLSGDRQLVFRAEDEAAVRERLRKLGFVVPPPG